MATISTTVYGVEAAKAIAEPKVMGDVSLNYGKIRYFADSYTIPAADQLGTSAAVNMFKIPKGGRVIEMMITAPSDGTTGQYDIGWLASKELDPVTKLPLVAADADGFFAGADADTGAGALARKAMAATVEGYRKKFAAEVQVQLDVIEATTASNGDTLLLEAYIVCE